MPELDPQTGNMRLTADEKAKLVKAKSKYKVELQRPTAVRLGDYDEPWNVQVTPPQPQAGPPPDPFAYRIDPTTWVPLGQTLPEQPYPQPAQPEGVVANIEGMQTVTRRRAAVEEGEPDPMKWTIKELVYRKNGMFEVVAENTDGHGIRYAYEPYFDAYVTPRTAVHSVSKNLMKTFAEKGLDVQPAHRPQKPDMMEEMYQLLSIIMEDKDMRTKFGSAWTTVRNQYDDQF